VQELSCKFDDLGHLVNCQPLSQAGKRIILQRIVVLSMTEPKPNAAAGTDWTGLLADPDLARNLGKLLQIYSGPVTLTEVVERPAQHPVPTPAAATPPFEPNIFSSNWGQDRRRHPRIKCFVAVELRVDDGDVPVWGNLSNTSMGGCQVETAAHISGGAKVEIGLWVASGKIWVKGLALNGVVTQSASSDRVRIRFAGMEPSGKENLRQFLRYVQETTRAAASESSYLKLLK
jgi:hypothetical protein